MEQQGAGEHTTFPGTGKREDLEFPDSNPQYQGSLFILIFNLI